jgi:hypothetical protein
VGSREVRPKFRRGMPGTAGNKSCAKKKSAKCPAGEIHLTSVCLRHACHRRAPHRPVPHGRTPHGRAPPGPIPHGRTPHRHGLMDVYIQISDLTNGGDVDLSRSKLQNTSFYAKRQKVHRSQACWLGTTPMPWPIHSGLKLKHPCQLWAFLKSLGFLASSSQSLAS